MTFFLNSKSFLSFLESASLFKKWVFFLLLSFLIFYPSLIYPFMDVDELIWGEMAMSLFRGDCPPYLCVIGEKPPFIYMLYHFVFSVFGQNNYFTVHLFHILWVSFTALLISNISKKNSSVLDGIFYLILMGLPGFTTLAATGESFMNFFLVLSWKELIDSKEKNIIKGFLIGLLIGIASLFRHQGSFQILAASAWILISPTYSNFNPKISKKIQFILSMFIAFAIAWGCVSFWMWEVGSWSVFKQWVVLHNVHYVQTGSVAPEVWKDGAFHLFNSVGSTLVFWLLASYSILNIKKSCSSLEKSAVYILLFSFLAACIGFRFFPHYFIQSFPALAVLARLGYQKLRRSHHNRISWIAKGAVILSLIAVITLGAFTGTLQQLNVAKKDYAPINKEIGDYIQNHSEPQDFIFVWGWGQGIYYYSNRRIGTRFIISDYLSGRVPASNAKKYSSHLSKEFTYPGMWDLFIEDMEKNKPLYFLDTSPASIHDYQYFPMGNFPRLSEYIQSHYNIETSIEDVILYRRKNS